MKPTIYLHIGPHKTGTKNIQLNLFNNIKTLNKKGYVYPKSGRVFEGHHNIVFDVLGHKYFDPPFGDLKSLEKELSKETKNVILSAETFSMIVKKEPLEKIKKIFEDKFDFKIIAYLRRQDEVINSYWKTELQMGYVHQPFNIYVNQSIREKKFLFYDQWLGVFADVFGRKNIETVFYENSLDKHFRLFLKKCDIKDAKGFKITKESHPSWSNFTAIVYLRVLTKIRTALENKSTAQSWDERVEEELKQRSFIAEEVDKYINSHKLDRKVVVYNQAMYDKVLNTFKASNKLTAKEYFNTDKMFVDWAPKKIENKRPLADFPKTHLREMHQSILKSIKKGVVV